MQWLARIEDVSGYEQLAHNIDTCDVEPEEDSLEPPALEQVRAARTAAKDIVASGALGHAETSSFRVELQGVLDEDEEDAASGMISVQVFRS